MLLFKDFNKWFIWKYFGRILLEDEDILDVGDEGRVIFGIGYICKENDKMCLKKENILWIIS